MLRWLLRMLGRLCIAVLASALLFAGWRACLRYGPGWRGGPAAPALFPFHAEALVKQRLAFPWPVEDAVLPVPATMSSADVQLRLMKWWDGKQWLPEALAHGEREKGGLRLHAGELVLAEVAGVGAPEVKDGVTRCTVRLRVRWDVPEALQELFRVKEIVGLRMPRGLVPGQAEAWTCVLVRRGWDWTPLQAETKRGAKLAGLDKVARHRPLDWLW
jgi:hypothetical protein